MHSSFLIINKPAGPTSHDVVDQVRKITGEKKVGHAGTLDPFATGVLVIGVRRGATKLFPQFVGLDKSYSATLRLGAVSNTYDKDGEIIKRENIQPPTEETIKETLTQFTGQIDQVPPMFSAKKVQGKKLYELARQGIEIERQAVKVNIHSIELKDYLYPKLTIDVVVSAGTYIRSLAHDIGNSLGTGAYLADLSRTSVGPFKLEEAVELNELTHESWEELAIEPEEMLERLLKNTKS